MSGYDWASKADSASAAIARYGAEVGVIILQDGGGGDPWDTQNRRQEVLSGRGIVLNFSHKAIDGTAIKAGDIKLMLSADIKKAPSVGDWVNIGLERYSIMNVNALQPGGVPLLYELHLRK